MYNLFDKYRYHCAAFCSGLILILAYPPFDLGFVAWLALIPLIYSSLELTPLKALGAGIFFALP